MEKKKKIKKKKKKKNCEDTILEEMNLNYTHLNTEDKNKQLERRIQKCCKIW